VRGRAESNSGSAKRKAHPGVVTDVLTNNPSRGILDASAHWHRHCTGYDMVEESLHNFPLW
jgi:hypothetical protein